jgi:hypothetical protein
MIMDLVDGTLVVPLLLGLFWGAPMLAKEYEDGTQNLVWTQGVTRRRWLRTNIIWVFAAAAVWAGTMTALVSWWRGPENALDSRFGAFDVQGVVPVAYAIFAVALGIAVGSVVRRVLPALAVTLAAFIGLRAVVVAYLRPHYLAAVVKLMPFMSTQGGAPAGSWVLSSGIVGPGGRQFGNAISIDEIPSACRTDFLGAQGVTAQCLQSHGFRQMVSFQPAGRFWAFQGIEAAIFLAVAAVLVALTYRMVLARDA